VHTLKKLWNSLSFNAVVLILGGILGLVFWDYLGDRLYSGIVCGAMIASGLVVWHWPDAVYGLLICVGMALIGMGIYVCIRGNSFLHVLFLFAAGGLLSNWGVSEIEAKWKRGNRPTGDENASSKG
jgi:hypothetical protein